MQKIICLNLLGLKIVGLKIYINKFAYLVWTDLGCYLIKIVFNEWYLLLAGGL